MADTLDPKHFNWLNRTRSFGMSENETPITREWLESIKPDDATEFHDSIYFHGDLDSDFCVKWNGETDEYYNLTDDCIWRGVISQEQLLRLFDDNSVSHNRPCTCKPDCPSACKGGCGCEACRWAYNDQCGELGCE